MIDISLVSRLIGTQFPQWKDLPIKPVSSSGWDNKTFHLGKHMLVRMPSSAHYEAQVEKEQFWLPKLESLLPLPIPQPLALGRAAEGYPWKWSIYRWLEGDTATPTNISDLCVFATNLGQFLTELQRINTTGAPLPGNHNFYRGGDLKVYHSETQQAIAALKGKIDTEAATRVWEEALATNWNNDPVWIHGDIALGNLLVRDGQLCAVIDFGMMAIGDPACDLTIAWTLLKDKSREIFRTILRLDEDTWTRGRAWTLWKAMILAAGICESNCIDASQPWRIIEEVLADYKQNT